jgi:DNA (cytosine-5)-methyltransferase 1
MAEIDTPGLPKRTGTFRPKLLDLFCGAGGAAMGYHRAGFEVVGVDIKPQPRYPFRFVQEDALAVLEAFTDGYDMLAIPDDDPLILSFNAIHASPPCQAYSDLAKRNKNADKWPKLVEPVRELLQFAGAPYIIENVEGAPLLDPITLCGVSFPELRVIRHRLFEASFDIDAPAHKAHPLVFTYDKRKAHYGKLDQDTSFVSVTGGGNCTADNKRAAMGVPWMTGAEANEAVPPAYTQYLGAQLLDYLVSWQAA